MLFRSRDHGVITSPDGRQIVAFGRLNGPNWYLLLTYPKALMFASAARSVPCSPACSP